MKTLTMIRNRACSMKANRWLLIVVLAMLVGLPPAQASIVNSYYWGLWDLNDFLTCPAKCSDCGMPRWEVSEPQLNLFVTDTPLSYQPAYGPTVAAQLIYKQRGCTATITNIFGFNTNWSSAFRLYAAGMSSTLVTLQTPDGASRDYVPDGTTLERVTRTRLLYLGSGSFAGYELQYPNGAKDTLTTYYTNAGTVYSFPTESADPVGNKLKFYYTNTANYFRLVLIVDAQGQTNYVRYGEPVNSYGPNLITEIANPWGYKATFKYNSAGLLTNITDTADLSSAIYYDSSGYITNLITPYGTTLFEYYSSTDTSTTNSLVRAVRVTEPNSARQLWMYSSSASWLPESYDDFPSDLPAGLESLLYNDGMTNRNSWHWDRRQHDQLSSAAKTNFTSLTSDDFDLATLKNWLATTNFGLEQLHYASKSLNMSREGKPAASASTGQKTWYGYEGKPATSPHREGTHFVPDLVVRVRPNDESQYIWRQFDATFAQVTNVVTTYSKADGTVGTRTNQFIYSSDGIDLLREIGPDGTSVFANGFNAQHQLTSSTNAVGDITSWYYEIASPYHLSQIVYPQGLTAEYNYNAEGFVDRIVNPEIVATNSFTYSNGLVRIHTDPLGSSRVFLYDGLQRPVSTIYSDGTLTSNRYSRLDLTASKDRLGNWTYFAYDTMGWRTAITNARSAVTLFNHCSCGALDSVQDAEGNITYFYYDNLSRRIATVMPDGKWTTNYFNQLGQVTNIVESAGASVTNYFNNQGLPSEARSQFGQILKQQYDLYDRITNSVDANGQIAELRRDAAGRVVSQRRLQSGGTLYSSEGFLHNAAGVRIVTNELGYLTQFGYDAAGRKTSETNANTEVTRFTYDAAGDLLTLTDGKSQVTTWKYDVFGRVTNKTDAASNVIFRYGYDGLWSNIRNIAGCSAKRSGSNARKWA